MKRLICGAYHNVRCAIFHPTVGKRISYGEQPHDIAGVQRDMENMILRLSSISDFARGQLEIQSESYFATSSTTMAQSVT